MAEVVTLCFGGRVHAPGIPRANALAVAGGAVAWVGVSDGSQAPVRADRAVDLRGAFVAPAFVDAHVPIVAFGATLVDPAAVDLRHCASARQLLDLVAGRVRAAGGRPVLGLGWDDEGWPDGVPGVRDLDRAAYGGVVVLVGRDRGRLLQSSAALADGTVDRLRSVAAGHLASLGVARVLERPPRAADPVHVTHPGDLSAEQAVALAAAGVPVAFGSWAPDHPADPWLTLRTATVDPAGPRLSARAAFRAHTEAGWRAAGERGGRLLPGWPATFAVWDAGELAVRAPDDRVERWSTDPRSAVPGLPAMDGDPTPRCLATVVAGRAVHGGAVVGLPGADPSGTLDP